MVSKVDGHLELLFPDARDQSTVGYLILSRGKKLSLRPLSHYLSESLSRISGYKRRAAENSIGLKSQKSKWLKESDQPIISNLIICRAESWGLHGPHVRHCGVCRGHSMGNKRRLQHRFLFKFIDLHNDSDIQGG
jgi:hypothetical protein